MLSPLDILAQFNSQAAQPEPSNTNLIIAAAVLVGIILAGLLWNLRRKK